jgi:hypothetical protein
MTDRREEFRPYWPWTIDPFGTLPQPSWLPSASPTAPGVDHLDSAKYWGTPPDDPAGQQAPPSRGLLYSLSDYPVPNHPWPAPPPVAPSRNRFDADDLAKSFGIGLAHGAIGLPAMFGDARELFASGAHRLADYIAPGYGPAVGNAVSYGMRLMPNMGGPTSAQIRGLIEPFTGRFYEPQTVAGDYLRTAGEFVPGLAAPGGVAKNAARYVVAPALASEYAGQSTQGTWMEPWARAIAALATGGAGAALEHLPGALRVRPGPEPMPRPGGAGDVPTAMTRPLEVPNSAPPSDPLAVSGFGAEGIPSHLEPGSVRPPPGRRGLLFDDSRLHEIPPVPQFNLPRSQPTQGVPEDILRALDNPATKADLHRFTDLGLERGGHKAANLEPFRERFLERLGSEEGQGPFKQFTDFMGATSPVSPDLSIAREASFYDELAKQQQALPKPFWDSSRRQYVLPDPLPYPWGHFKQGLHAKLANEVVTQMGLNPLTGPKVASMAEQFRGNQMPIPIDRHILRALGLADSRGLPPTSYGFTEDFLQRFALNKGLTPGQLQGAIRAGAAELTGLRSPNPMLTTLAQRIAITAEREQTSPEEILRRLITGGQKLRAVGAGSALGTAASTSEQGESE